MIFPSCKIQSVALENYLEETKLEIVSAIFRPRFDNISGNIRNAINALKRNSKINLKKADKGTTTVILNTAQNIDDGLQQLCNDKFYKPLSSPIVHNTARKAKELVSKLYRSGHIDLMTHKWLTICLKQPRIPEFYTLTTFNSQENASRQTNRFW